MLLRATRKAKAGSIGLWHLCPACESAWDPLCSPLPSLWDTWPEGERPGHTATHGLSVHRQSHSGKREGMARPCGLSPVLMAGPAHALLSPPDGSSLQWRVLALALEHQPPFLATF